jgi:hypothetical protein
MNTEVPEAIHTVDCDCSICETIGPNPTHQNVYYYFRAKFGFWPRESFRKVDIRTDLGRGMARAIDTGAQLAHIVADNERQLIIGVVERYISSVSE